MKCCGFTRTTHENAGRRSGPTAKVTIRRGVETVSTGDGSTNNFVSLWHKLIETCLYSCFDARVVSGSTRTNERKQGTTKTLSASMTAVNGTPL